MAAKTIDENNRAKGKIIALRPDRVADARPFAKFSPRLVIHSPEQDHVLLKGKITPGGAEVAKIVADRSNVFTVTPYKLELVNGVKKEVAGTPRLMKMHELLGLRMAIHEYVVRVTTNRADYRATLEKIDKALKMLKVSRRG